MKIYQTNEIRNISLLGNAGCGKTILAETMLFLAGAINRRGDINSKNTVSDYREIEHEQEGSVYSTIMHVEYNGKKINIIDTPGADDFVGGVISSLRVTDTAVLVLNTQNSIEVGAETGWRNITRNEKAAILLANHLDHDKTNFDKTIEEAKQKFGNKIVLAQYPVDPGPEFSSIIDLIKMKMYKYSGTEGKAEITDIPASELDKAEELHAILIEAAAESDEQLMETFFENETLTEEEMRSGIIKGIQNRNLFPVFCTSAKKAIGVDRLMEFISVATPSPDQMPAMKNSLGEEILCDATKSTSLFFFKNSIEQHLGEILFFKVVSGEVTESIDLINTNKSGKERLSQLFAVSGKSRTKVTKMIAGDIGATVKLKETKTGHTLCEKGMDWTFPNTKFPDPKYRTAIKALNESDDEKLGEILHRLAEEDPTYILEYSKELKQLIVHGQGEHHLNTLKWHVTNTNKIDIEFLTPKIPYRETITKPAQATFRHKKQSGGAGQFGEVHMIIEPFEDGKPAPSAFKIAGKEYTVNVRGTDEYKLDWGGKLVFVNCIVGGVIDARYLPAIVKGVMEKMEFGPLTGSYARDIRVCVYDGKMHPVDSNEISFKLAGAKAFSAAFKEAGPKIMEPVYDVEVLVPSDRMGDVMSDLQGRRAVIQGMSSEGGYEKLNVRVPLAELNKYSTVLSSLTSGRATYTMRFAEYQQVPAEVQQELLKSYQEENSDD